MDERNQNLLYKQYVRREEQTFHEPMDDEQVFYSAVRSGNTALINELLQEHNLSKKKALGTLSDSPLQNKKYHFAISAALVARHCMEGGMLREDAFLLSDYYIHQADCLQEESAIDPLLHKMFVDYTKRMQSLVTSPYRSKEISRCIDYIYEHLHERLTTQALADYIGFERSYLSRLFKQQTGESVSAYILARKLETAQRMLLYSEYEIAMIAQILAFPSQSYFTTVFKRHYGETPKQYRNRHYKQVYG